MSGIFENGLIPEHDMAGGADFIFGTDYFVKSNKITWNPDSRTTANPHLLIWGESGSGKTRLLKHLVKYLERKKKIVYVIDFHGDIEVEGENYIEFTARNSEYGINPFEFDKDQKNGGIRVQAGIIVDIFRKAFMPNMGSIQQSVLKNLIIDTYAYVGITDADTNTWEKELPTTDDLIIVFNEIKNYIELENGHSIGKLIYRLQQNKKKDVVFKVQNKVIQELFDEINCFTDYILNNNNLNIFNSMLNDNIDMAKYTSENVKKSFLNLETYIMELSESNVFSDSRPNLIAGVNRFDVSGFTNTGKPHEAIFFSEVMLQKIFKAKKIRGEYHKYSNKSRGYKCDTFVIIDESKIIMPTGKEKENPYNALNRIATESRKYGLGLIIVSQRPNHYPQEILGNFYTKVSLKINGNDAKSASTALGIRDHNLLELSDKNGVALIGSSARSFKATLLPWGEPVQR